MEIMNNNTRRALQKNKNFFSKRVALPEFREGDFIRHYSGFDVDKYFDGRVFINYRYGYFFS